MVEDSEEITEMDEVKQRIIQELVPGKQISLAHIIANPDKVMYTKLGLDPTVDYSKSAIGIMTVSPAEAAIIMGDIAMKASAVEIGFVDRFSGSLIVTGTVSQVEAAVNALDTGAAFHLQAQTVQDYLAAENALNLCGGLLTVSDSVRQKRPAAQAYIAGGISTSGKVTQSGADWYLKLEASRLSSLTAVSEAVRKKDGAFSGYADAEMPSLRK